MQNCGLNGGQQLSESFRVSGQSVRKLKTSSSTTSVYEAHHMVRSPGAASGLCGLFSPAHVYRLSTFKHFLL